MIAQVPESPESCVLKVEVPTHASGIINTHHNLLKLADIQNTNEILLMSDKRSGSHMLSDQNHYRPCLQC